MMVKDGGESTDGEDDDREGKDEKTEEPKPKSKFQEYLAKARTQALLDPEPEEKDTPQNIFADPRRVVFPISKSMMLDDEVPGTPVETRHFGPAPPGRVARRNKTRSAYRSRMVILSWTSLCRPSSFCPAWATLR
jgi:hypothetical protein